jgi:hypothetical protein
MKVGLICAVEMYGTLEDKYTSGFGLGITSYFYALTNLFGDVLLVKSANDLGGLDCLFICNYHFGPHKSIWTSQDFIDRCNQKNLLCIFWSNEQILSPIYPWNSDLESVIRKFNNYRQTVYDVDDSIKMNKKLGRGPNSIEYKFLKKNVQKKNGIVFVGSTNPVEYKLRNDTINELKEKFENFDIFPNRMFRSVREYFEVISEYRFVLCPHSTTFNGITSRFYDALLVNSIPLQQVYSNTMDFYPEESRFEDAVYFETVGELIGKVQNYKLLESYNNVWLEDVLKDFFNEELGCKF